MRQDWEPEDLIEVWTLLEDDMKRVRRGEDEVARGAEASRAVCVGASPEAAWVVAGLRRLRPRQTERMGRRRGGIRR